jgi:hypothetical protein
MQNRTKRPPAARAASRRSASAGPVSRLQPYLSTSSRSTARVPPELARKAVYLAAPLVAFDSLAYERTQDALVRAGCFVIAARDEFGSTADWLARFGDVLSKVQALVVVPGPGGVVGAGVLREIVEAIVLGIPAYFADGNRFHPLRRVSMTFLPDAERARCARITLQGRRS